MDNNLKRAIIIDNYENPYHKKEINNNKYFKANTHNESCIDNIDLFIEFDGDIIKDAYFNGEACAITTSATSIMLKKIIGMNINDAKELMQEYYHMINEEKYDESKVGELNVYVDISKQPSRIKCATLPFQTLEKIFKIEGSVVNEK